MRLICEKLSIGYGKKVIIKPFDCEFKASTATAIIGPNGAGKSSLLKTIMGLNKQLNGKIIFENLLNKDIAYLPQYNDLDQSIPLKVEDVMLLYTWYETSLLKGINKDIYDGLYEALRKVNMLEQFSTNIDELSKGQLQRVLFARTIMQDSSIIILDEPFNAIDTNTTHELLILIESLKNKSKTIIAVMHNLQHVYKHFEYTLLLSDGNIFYDKTIKIFKDHNIELKGFVEFDSMNNCC